MDTAAVLPGHDSVRLDVSSLVLPGRLVTSRRLGACRSIRLPRLCGRGRFPASPTVGGTADQTTKLECREHPATHVRIPGVHRQRSRVPRAIALFPSVPCAVADIAVNRRVNSALLHGFCNKSCVAPKYCASSKTST